jgi:hypothetical protein
VNLTTSREILEGQMGIPIGARVEIALLTWEA